MTNTMTNIIHLERAALSAAPAPPTRTLSPSQVSTYLDCAARWWYDQVSPPAAATAGQALGKAVHAAIALDIEARINGVGDASQTDIEEEARACWRKEAATAELRSDEDAGKLEDQAAALTWLFAREATPLLFANGRTIRAIEKPVSGAIGTAHTRGVIDILTSEGEVIDIKTASRKPTGISSAHALQLTTYGLLEHTTKGRIITLTKTKEPALYHATLQITPRETQYAASMFSMVADAIGAGIHIPNRGSNLCSRKQCANWRVCQDEHGGHVRD